MEDVKAGSQGLWITGKLRFSTLYQSDDENHRLESVNGEIPFQEKIMMDELRDYRFYAEDMIHPNNLAINYIWEKFCEFSFNDKVKTDISEIEKVARSVAHRPLNPESPSHKKFKANTLQQIEQLQKKFPAINFQREREQLL